MDDEIQQPPRRERVGQRAWVRTVGLVGGGLVAGGILTGTLAAHAATDESTAAVPSYSQSGDCPEDAPGSTEQATTEEGTTEEGTTEQGTTEQGTTEGSSADATA